jgi:hypothetical protein
MAASGGVRTTLTIDEDIAKRLHAESRRTGRGFKTVVNDYLRAGLSHRKEVKAAAVQGGTLPRETRSSSGRSFVEGSYILSRNMALH